MTNYHSPKRDAAANVSQMHAQHTNAITTSKQKGLKSAIIATEESGNACYTRTVSHNDSSKTDRKTERKNKLLLVREIERRRALELEECLLFVPEKEGNIGLLRRLSDSSRTTM